MKRPPIIGELHWSRKLETGKTTLMLGEQTHPAGFITRIQRIWDEPGALTMSIEVIDRALTLNKLWFDLPVVYADGSRIFANGLQSWTESREFNLDESIPRLRGPFTRYLNTTGDYLFFPAQGKPGYFHSHMSTYLRHPDGSKATWTEMRQEAGYTIFEHRTPERVLRIHKDCACMRIEAGKQVALMHVEIAESQAQAPFLPDSAESLPEALPVPLSGWTSWYHYYTKITEGIILENLAAFSAHHPGPGVFQIDDGWQAAVGDWTTANKKFPQGMGALAKQIQSQGHKAGLWLAPFIVEQKSSIYQQHPDWILTHDGEHQVSAGYNPGWGGLFHGTYYPLDINLPEVQAHLAEVFRVILHDWGFDLVKLDFLFAVGIYDRPLLGSSRGMQMHKAMELLRSWCGDKLILGCGVPLGPARNLVDFCRIGPDVGLSWDMKSAEKLNLRERISTRNALRNTIGRFDLAEKGFRNDPDVFILRSTKNKLSPAQRRTGFILNNLLGDLIFTSDKLSEYDADTLALYQSAFPVPRDRHIQIFPLAHDIFRIEAVIQGRHYQVFANLSAGDFGAALPLGHYFSEGRYIPVDVTTLRVPAFSTAVCLQLDWTSDPFIGSNLHIFPGTEVQKLAWDPQQGYTVEFHPHTRKGGQLWIRVPAGVASVQVNGQAHTVKLGLFGEQGYVEVGR